MSKTKNAQPAKAARGTQTDDAKAQADAPRPRRGGRPRKDTRSLVVTSSDAIDKACDTMVALGLSKTRSTAATKLLTVAAKNFLRNSANMIAPYGLWDLANEDLPSNPTEAPAPRRRARKEAAKGAES